MARKFQELIDNLSPERRARIDARVEQAMSEMPRWADRTYVTSVQFDYESTPKPRAVRLSAAALRVGDPIRVVVGGVEVEGVIDEVAFSTVHVLISKKPDGPAVLAYRLIIT